MLECGATNRWVVENYLLDRPADLAALDAICDKCAVADPVGAQGSALGAHRRGARGLSWRWAGPQATTEEEALRAKCDAAAESSGRRRRRAEEEAATQKTESARKAEEQEEKEEALWAKLAAGTISKDEL